MVLCHPSAREAAGLDPLLRAHRCWRQLCGALAQRAPGLPVCSSESKWTATLSPNCPQAATWLICGPSEFLLNTGRLALPPTHGRMRLTASSLTNRPVSAPMPVFTHQQAWGACLAGKEARRVLGLFLAFLSCVLGFPALIIFFNF